MAEDWDDDSVDQVMLDQQRHSKLEKAHETEGFRLGLEKGKEQNLQKGFNDGYKEAFKLAAKLAKYRGMLNAVLCYNNHYRKGINDNTLSADEIDEIEHMVSELAEAEKYLSTSFFNEKMSKMDLDNMDLCNLSSKSEMEIVKIEEISERAKEFCNKL